MFRFKGSVEVNFMEKMKFEQRQEGGKGVLYVAIWRKSIASKGNSQCKGLRTGMYLECLVNSKDASMPAGWQSRKR